MSFLGFHKKKTAPELVKSTVTALQHLEEEPDEKGQKKVAEKISQYLEQMKHMLYGDGQAEPKKEVVDKLCESIFASELLLPLLRNIKKLEFEARKDVAQIYNHILRHQRQPAVTYVEQHPQILELLVKGYEDTEISLNCGSILRECIRHQSLCEHVLNTPALFIQFFEYVQLSTFDVASDAFATFKVLLTKHKPVVAKFLENSFDLVFEHYNSLLESKNYVTKRQSLKLLSELLLDRANFRVMMKYINSPTNLKIIMNLLRGNTKAVQFEAFHVFKIFVANPTKSRPIVEILARNKEKLMDFLRKFQTEKEDEQFNEEKKILLSALAKLDEHAVSDDSKVAAAAAPAGSTPAPAPSSSANAAAPAPSAAGSAPIASTTTPAARTNLPIPAAR